MEILATFIGNLWHRSGESLRKSAVQHASLRELLPNGPPFYVRTQHADPMKARRTWRRAMRVYLATRKDEMPTAGTDPRQR